MHLHAADDVEHLRELRATITELPLTDTSSALIASSAFATMEGLVCILEDLIANKVPV
jgi:hypothetical protein